MNRIPRENIQPTFEQIKQNILFPLFGNDIDIFLLGSTGKKESSGDMDIGISIKSIDNNLSIMDNLKLIFKQIIDFNPTLEIQINSVTNDMIHFRFSTI